MENITHVQDDEVLVLEVSSEDEARREAASRWGISGDEVILNVIAEEKSFFGLFGKKLKIEARRAPHPKPVEPVEPVVEREVQPKVETKKPQSEVKKSEQHEDFITLLKRVLAAAQLDLEANVLPDGTINLTGPDSRILLAGRRGDGLKALDYIVNLMARNNGPVPHVRLDCDGFRRKRSKELERIALEAAKEAMRTRRTVYLQPMSSWERRIVHLTLKESSAVETHSIGVEPGRKVAIRLIGATSTHLGNRRSDRRGGGGRTERDRDREARPEKKEGGRRRRPRRRSRSKPKQSATEQATQTQEEVQ